MRERRTARRSFARERAADAASRRPLPPADRRLHLCRALGGQAVFPPSRTRECRDGWNGRSGGLAVHHHKKTGFLAYAPKRVAMSVSVTLRVSP